MFFLTGSLTGLYKSNIMMVFQSPFSAGPSYFMILSSDFFGDTLASCLFFLSSFYFILALFFNLNLNHSHLYHLFFPFSPFSSVSSIFFLTFYTQIACIRSRTFYWNLSPKSFLYFRI